MARPSDDKRYGAAGPRIGVDGARYLASLGVARVGAGTWAVEVLPGEKDTGAFPVHEIFLATNGIYNPGEHEYRRDGEGQGVGGVLHPRPRPDHPRDPSDHQSDRDQVTRSPDGTTRRCIGQRIPVGSCTAGWSGDPPRVLHCGLRR